MTGTPWDDGGTGAVVSVNGQSGAVTLSAADVDADPEGTAASAVAAHEAETDPHSGYPLRSEAGQPIGYATLDVDGLVVQNPASASATAGVNKLAKADPAGKLENGWGGAANSLATLDGSALVPTSQQGAGTADATTFLRGDRSWASALQGTLGSTDHALLRADGTGGLTAQGSNATLDDQANLTLGSRSLNQPISPSAWSGTISNHDLPIPSWATTAGKYVALVRLRIQQNSPTSSFVARTVQIELTYSGSAWSIDATGMYTSIGPLGTSLGWLISGGTNVRMVLSGLASDSAGNVGLVFEQFLFYGAL